MYTTSDNIADLLRLSVNKKNLCALAICTPDIPCVIPGNSFAVMFTKNCSYEFVSLSRTWARAMTSSTNVYEKL